MDAKVACRPWVGKLSEDLIAATLFAREIPPSPRCHAVSDADRACSVVGHEAIDPRETRPDGLRSRARAEAKPDVMLVTVAGCGDQVGPVGRVEEPDADIPRRDVERVARERQEVCSRG